MNAQPPRSSLLRRNAAQTRRLGRIAAGTAGIASRLRSIQEAIGVTKRLTAVTAAAVGLLIVSPVDLQAKKELPLVPLPSVFDFTEGRGWGGALGLGFEYETAYDGSDEYESGIEPAGAIQWRNGNHLFFWEGIELGWRGLTAEKWLMQAGARYEAGLAADDSKDGRLNGFVERDSHIVGFLEFRRAIGKDWRNWVGGRVLGGANDFGWLGVLAAGRRFGSSLDGTGTEIFAFSTFGTGTFITKDFGVTRADAVGSGLRETKLGGGYRSTGVQLIDRRHLTPKIQVIGSAGFELYSSDIKHSPVARKGHEIEAALSIVYLF